MSYSITSRDTAAIVTAMLPDMKAHVNVTFDDDDALLRRYLNWAIGYLEADTGLIFAPTGVVWWPEASQITGAPFPLWPVSPGFVVTDADTVDVSAAYRVETPKNLTEQSWLKRVDGGVLDTIKVVFTSGYTDPTGLPSVAEAYIFRVAATLYENRESISAVPSLDQIPSWMNDRLTGLWVPRA